MNKSKKIVRFDCNLLFFNVILVLSLIFVLSLNVSAKTIYIGAGIPLTGKNESEGNSMKNALQMYVDNLNNNGGVNGHTLKLIIKDDKNDKKYVKTVAKEFSENPDILAVIGHQWSSVSISAGEYYEKNQLIHISPSASNPKVTRNSSWVFSMNYQDEIQGESMAVYLKSVFGAKNVAIIHSNDAYGSGLKDSFSSKAKHIDLGLSQVIMFDEEKKFDDTFIQENWNFNDSSTETDAVVIFAHTDDGAKIVKQLRKHKINVPVIGPDAFAKKQFIDGLEGLEKNVLVAGPFLYELSSLKTKLFQDAFIKKFKKEPTVWASFCYDALDMIVEGIRQGKTTRKELRDYLASITSPKESHQGITGSLFFDKNGAMARQIVVSMIDESSFKPAFTQIQLVTESHVLSRLEKKVSQGDVVIVDEVPYYLTRVVYTGIDFIRVNSVDVKDQNFDIEFFMWFRWQGNVNVEKIDFINAIFGIEDTKEVLRKDFSGKTKYISFKMKGTYLTPYDLRLFPFDKQYLPMTMAHKTKDAKQLMLVVDHKNLSHAELKRIYPEEWTYLHREDYSGTFEEHSTFGDPNYMGGSSKVDFSVYQSNIVIQRILFPYLVKLFMPLLIIIILSLFVFIIPWEQFDARLTLVMTSLLSILVFHMSQSEALPSVGYMIKADQFFMVAYILLFSLVTMTIAVNILVKIGNEKLAKMIDRFFAYVFIVSVPISFGYLLITAF